LFVESLPQARPNGLARRFRWIERLVLENIGKNLTHWDGFCAPQNNEELRSLDVNLDYER
jgi:hypothetical protein